MNELCTRCDKKCQESEFLKELASSSERSVSDVVNRTLRNNNSSVRERSAEHTRQRLQQERQKLAQYRQELKKREEQLSYQASQDVLDKKDPSEVAEKILNDSARKGLEENVRQLTAKSQEVSDEDVRQTLKEFEQEGYIETQKGEIKITSKGARKLASNALERILGLLSSKDLGCHTEDKTGFGSELTTYSRPYEIGDDYAMVDVERTALAALERCGRLDLEVGDFQVFDETHQSKLCVGLLIDESGSMRSDYKLSAAVETALALSELIRREPKDTLKTFVFSETTKEIPAWGILNDMLSGGCTDIRAALRAFRNSVRSEKGDKQAYLITDTEPNTEQGKYIGFDRAMTGVLEEALEYRREGITLNIVMLDRAAPLKELASLLARKNLGRVFFTSPMKLGQVLLEDYLRVKKEKG
ncbi:MAG: hypothetical protein Q8P00_05920 [Dehalococcoidia bacterium]|nr:hypothetical protein [Dehalococcoidia bacterium]